MLLKLKFNFESIECQFEFDRIADEVNEFVMNKANIESFCSKGDTLVPERPLLGGFEMMLR
jgi:hypothetical protein